ncbi:MAG: phage shock protein operon transcriptional activator [Oceanicoccus sp.]
MNRPHKEIIGNSSALTLALDHLSQLAPIDRSVLIIGERGTGKELAAERLHFLSNRWEQSLNKVNCAAISDEILDSELFGHEPGAFTGANRIHHGRFERADGGTLFLDELGTMSQRLQEKLLRLIEYGEFERLGGQQTLTVDVRIVAATNVNLKKMATEGKFREDLLDRLSFDVVHLPPLRYRPNDIEQLANHFAVQMCTELEWDYFAGFSATAFATLMQHSWPGNIRELKNAVERSLYRWGDPNTPVDTIVLDPFISPYQPAEIELPTTPVTIETHEKTPDPDQEMETDMSSKTFTELIHNREINILTSSLKTNQGHQGRTAKSLGLSYHQLRGLLRKHKLGRTENS